MTAIFCEDLKHEYVERKTGRRRQSLAGISIAVPRGAIFGLLGPNGAGKTTSVRIFTTLLKASGGAARVLDLDVNRSGREIRSRIGVAFGGDKGFFGRLTGRQNLEYFGSLYGLSRSTLGVQIDRVLGIMELNSRADGKVATYSIGMKQRLHLARALLADPEVVFLDEPTVGLDPEIAQILRQHIQRLKAAGKTIFLTTHYMLEADQLCDQISIICNGRVVASGAPAQLKSGFGRLKVIECLLRELDKARLERVRTFEGVASVDVEERSSFPCAKVFCDESIDTSTVVEGFGKENLLGSPTVRTQTLEEAYLDIVRKSQ
ncbi:MULTISPECIES: ABC transporter ATP-binding protein [unclassified Neorhizobium]|uniref:ABC transporter ATP-binding protein n=1 Tax=unclassified Neorhizobium TaxID=2629175 RepID=UPI001FF4D3AE|nr:MULTISPECIES: ABC transporter ATP-binding protein [unclassified Neorhizobium]MCJ9672813.1 ABC transporter ATP-binding protein [Neorhizobium sp. SHOUNA12B]MCJ9748448.1 ABC transporter ATP-binding protein [Neorhizobium sp. SHOUNA12A]